MLKNATLQYALKKITTLKMYHYELQNIISGISNKKPGNLIQTVAHQLNSGKKQSVAIKKHKLSKQQEEEILRASLKTCFVV